jgi:phytoene desaturase
MSNHHAAVIGSGIGGIASALRLAAKGYKVTVYEQSSMPGGKISQFHHEGFRFDTGPSLFTLPALVDELFALFNEKPLLEYSRLKTSCKYFWDDATEITAWQDTGQFAREIEERTGVASERVHAFLEKSKRLYELTSEVFLFNSFHKFSNFTKPGYRKSLLHLYELDAISSMHKRNASWFRHPKIVQLFDRYATYNGSSPYRAPATLNVIAHLEHNLGAFFPKNGMYGIVESLVSLAKRQGVEFIFNTTAQEIILEKNKAKAIRIHNQIIPYDIIISNLDIVNLYQNLIPSTKIPSNQIKAERSSSALIFYWGIKKEFPQLELHNILFSRDYRTEFDCIFEEKIISDDPTVYVFISSKHVKSDAPKGMENWYVMINVPENKGQPWDEMITGARAAIIKKINLVLNTNIEELILFEHIHDPRTIEQRTGSYHGSLYGPSSNGRFSAFLRHPNFSSRFRNLYFTGGSVHPGGGIPLCLASAKIAVQEVKSVINES